MGGLHVTLTSEADIPDALTSEGASLGSGQHNTARLQTGGSGGTRGVRLISLSSKIVASKRYKWTLPILSWGMLACSCGTLACSM